MVGLTGSHGFLATILGEHLVHFKRLGRKGEVPKGITFLYDFAAFGNMSWHTDINKIYKANLIRVINLTRNCILNDCKLVFVSTSSVKLSVQTPYSLSKKAAEEFIQYQVQSNGLKACIVRPFTIIGVGERVGERVGEQKEHLIPRLIDSCLNGVEMPFVKKPVHDFLDVKDLSKALILIKDKGLFEGEIYEVGTGKQFSNDEVRSLVEKVTGKRANIRLVESMRPYDTKDWRANIERICGLGWSPTISLEESIKEMCYVYEKTNS